MYTSQISHVSLNMIFTCQHTHTLSVFESAPTFSNIKAVVNEKFTTVSLSDYLGSWFVLFFYPYDFTFVCPTEIVAFSDAFDDFAALNTKVAAISTDSHHTHLAWVKTPRENGGVGKLRIPLIADWSKRVSRSYGILIEDERDEMYGAAIRGTVLFCPAHGTHSLPLDVVYTFYTNTLNYDTYPDEQHRASVSPLLSSPLLLFPNFFLLSFSVTPTCLYQASSSSTLKGSFDPSKSTTTVSVEMLKRR
jgi:alkyl hydroperoxide reductase subunit AhpC